MSALKRLTDRSLVRWGIIGCGAVTEVKSGPGFQLARGSALTAVMRRSAALARDYAERHQVGRWYDDADKLINDPEVDAVYIATPPGSHMELTLAVARAGKPAYVEKPMARAAFECDVMVKAFEEKCLPLYVAYYRRCLPRFVTVREILSSGAIGRVESVNYVGDAPHHLKDSGWRVSAESAGGGHFLDVGSHVVDLLDFLFGPLEGVEGTARKLGPVGNVEDTVAMKFSAGSVSGSASWNFAASEAVDRMEIKGDKGSLCFAVFGDEPLEFESNGKRDLLSRPNPKHVAQPLIQSIVEDLLGKGICPSTGESGRRASKVMDAVLSGFYGGRSDAFWLRETSWPGLRA